MTHLLSLQGSNGHLHPRNLDRAKGALEGGIDSSNSISRIHQIRIGLPQAHPRLRSNWDAIEAVNSRHILDTVCNEALVSRSEANNNWHTQNHANTSGYIVALHRFVGGRGGLWGQALLLQDKMVASTLSCIWVESTYKWLPSFDFSIVGDWENVVKAGSSFAGQQHPFLVTSIGLSFTLLVPNLVCPLIFPRVIRLSVMRRPALLACCPSKDVSSNWIDSTWSNCS